MKVYFDNAATTALDKEVLEAMMPYLENQYGNPSSIHAFGRETRAGIELARKTIADLLNVSPGEIFFTSGGTEANNMAIKNSINTLQLTHAVSTRIEHHAVSHTLEECVKTANVKLSEVPLKEDGHVDVQVLEQLLKDNPQSLVSLMHANNEIGNMLPLEEVGVICKKYDAVFHSDTVQTMAHYQLDLQKLNIQFASCSGHKFHGPKGVGFLYINSDIKIDPFLLGGSQERNMRGGTENLYGIIGMGKAFEIAHRSMKEDTEYITGLKSHMAESLKAKIPNVEFNGDCMGDSLYTVLNISLPPTDNSEMLLFNLDIAGIAASGGSACSSGSNIGSHVLEGINSDMTRPAIRFSFSKHNTIEEVEYCVARLAELVNVPQTVH